MASLHLHHLTSCTPNLLPLLHRPTDSRCAQTTAAVPSFAPSVTHPCPPLQRQPVRPGRSCVVNLRAPFLLFLKSPAPAAASTPGNLCSPYSIIRFARFAASPWANRHLQLTTPGRERAKAPVRPGCTFSQRPRVSSLDHGGLPMQMSRLKHPRSANCPNSKSHATEMQTKTSKSALAVDRGLIPKMRLLLMLVY